LRVRRRLAVGLLVTLAVVFAALLVVKTWAGSDSMRERVRAKAIARLGEGVTLGDDFSVDWRGTVRLGPLSIASSTPELPPVVSVARISVRPRWRALIKGLIEPGWVRFEEVTLEAGQNGGELGELLERVRGERQAGLATSEQHRSSANQLPELHFSEATVRATLRERVVELGADSGRVIIHRDEDANEMHLEIGIVPRGGGEFAVAVAGSSEGIRTSEIALRDGVALKALMPFKEVPVEEGTVELTAHLRTEQQHRVGSLDWRIVADGVVLTHARLASSPVGPMRMACAGRLSWNVETQAISVSPLELSFGSTDQVKLEGAVTLQSESEFSVRLQTVGLELQNAIAALPTALAPGEISDEVTGPLSMKLDVKGQLRRPAEWQLQAKLDLTALRSAARQQPHALNRPFVYKTTLFDGRAREVLVGPGNPAFVPLAEVPRTLIRAVLLSEDSMFMTHQGFDFFEMKNDMFVENENGEVLRGASTMTQQLAKNLYLSREKTYARKVREAFLTIALEAAVPKERLLEIYLNIIEWGPGLNGIGEASTHYFGKRPGALTVKEAAYLATIIPGPIRYYSFFTKGELPEVWERRVADLLNKMHSAGDLSDEETELAIESPLVFRPRTP